MRPAGRFTNALGGSFATMAADGRDRAAAFRAKLAKKQKLRAMGVRLSAGGRGVLNHNLPPGMRFTGPASGLDRDF